jgi:hypothetical protein
LKRLLLTLFAVALTAGLLGCGGGGDESSNGTTSTALTSCDISGRQQDLGASYVTTIQVAKVSCAQAEKIVEAYHGCRRKNGGAGGTCDTAVMGFTCTEGPRQSVPGVQFNATADCRKGDAEIKSAYTQNF